jgi:hypothetical protein
MSLPYIPRGYHAGYQEPLAVWEGKRQLVAYVELMGRQPNNFAKDTEGWEQFMWPNAKLRKRNKLTLEQVANVTVDSRQLELAA